MANTWFATFPDVAIGTANKSHADLWNPSGSGRVIRVYKIYALNNYRATGINAGMNLYHIARITALTVAGTVVTPVRADTSLENWAATSCTAHYASTVTEGAVFRRFIRSSDDVGMRTVTQFNYWGSIHEMAKVWDTGCNDDAVLQPIVIREDSGIHIKYLSGKDSTGTLTVVMEFTTDTT